MRNTLLLTIFFLFLIGTNTAYMQEQDEGAEDAVPVILPDTETLSITSVITERDYEISVALPASYTTLDQSYPVLYVLDPAFAFLSVTEFVRWMSSWGELPELIVVGVGYPTDDMEEIMRLRESDYYIEQDDFLQLFQEELFPLIETNYRVDTTDRALLGFSYGGDFAFHVLVNKPELFHRYITISTPGTEFTPYLLKNDEEFWGQFADLDIKLFNSTEGEELLSTALQTRNYEGLDATGLLLGDVTHAAALHLSLPEGILAVYAD